MRLCITCHYIIYHKQSFLRDTCDSFLIIKKQYENNINICFRQCFDNKGHF